LANFVAQHKDVQFAMEINALPRPQSF